MTENPLLSSNIRRTENPKKLFGRMTYPRSRSRIFRSSPKLLDACLAAALNASFRAISSCARACARS